MQAVQYVIMSPAFVDLADSKENVFHGPIQSAFLHSSPVSATSISTDKHRGPYRKGRKGKKRQDTAFPKPSVPTLNPS